MAAVLIPALGNAKELPEIVTAVGLLGDLSAVRPLVELLSVEEVAELAAEALYVIVGARLFEEVLVPDPVSEDEMLEQEIAEYQETGELPRRPDGEPFGTRVRRLARDPEVWSDWLSGNASGFVAGQRYRLGEPCTPRLLLDCLRDETFPKRYRPWVAEELQIRYRVDLPFEVDMFVVEQRRVLDAAVAAMAGKPVEFEPGQWHFAAHPTF